ncbi:unnamed protein product, partial [Rotaria sp. Silwood2]
PEHQNPEPSHLSLHHPRRKKQNLNDQDPQPSCTSTEPLPLTSSSLLPIHISRSPPDPPSQPTSPSPTLST